MYSFNSLNSYSVLGHADENEDWEIDVKILKGSIKSQSISVPASKIVPLFKPYYVFQNNYCIKLKFFTGKKVNIKINDVTGYPVYLRQFLPGSSDNTMEINTSGWNGGRYALAFTDAIGTNFAIGEFDIR
ncbi:hypothetical protein [Prevotella sp. 10(H)]|uniref:DUF3244 domain-containing protein n=1 Tax=Prevotella sp. 10(H) TaxID=1158294 RepID=UPI0004A6ACE1|nr:hypothetical protein [Prevotella sp. 10(H)]